MKMGMVDRGASLRWLSQYPHENEILFAPLLGLEAVGSRVDGNMLLVEIALSNNMNSLTLEQVVSKRRKVCVDMLASMQLELNEELNELRWQEMQHDLKWEPPLQQEARKSLASVNSLLLSTPAEIFNDDDYLASTFKSVVGVRCATSLHPTSLHP